MDLSELKEKETPIDLYRVPERKDESGWRGPCILLDKDADEGTARVKHQGIPYIVPLRHVRKHVACLVFLRLCHSWQKELHQTWFVEYCGSPSIQTFLSSIQTMLLTFLDYVDGCQPHEVFLHGRWNTAASARARTS